MPLRPGVEFEFGGLLVELPHGLRDISQLQAPKIGNQAANSILADNHVFSRGICVEEVLPDPARSTDGPREPGMLVKRDRAAGRAHPSLSGPVAKVSSCFSKPDHFC